MIVTVTLNPSVDINYTLPKLQLDGVNRVEEVSKTAGGKGLNVSRVLRQLGEEVAATGFLGGDLGNFLRKKIKELGISDYFIPIADETRNCIAVLHEGMQTEILEPGPFIQEKEKEAFLSTFQRLIKAGNIITISGSLPEGLPKDFYKTLLHLAASEKKRMLIDVNGELLKRTLRADKKPFLIKPNQAELADLVGIRDMDETEVFEALRSPLLQGIEWVVVSLGNRGAIIRFQEKIFRVHIPRIEAVNTVGSGDSVLAGFASGLHKHLTGLELMKYGVAMGVLNAMEEKTGYINPNNIPWCINEITVEQIG